MKINQLQKLLAASGLVLATITFGVTVVPQVAMFETTCAVASEPTFDEALVAHADRLSNAFRQAATVAQPSVVTIISEKRPAVRQQRRGESPSMPEELRRFFGDDFERFFQRPQPDFGDAQRGFASGIIISGDGYILTNNHVVAGDPRITVKLGLLSDKAVELAEGTSESDELGMTVRTLTSELSRELGLHQDQPGVVVTQVEPGGVAQRAGLQPKDIILSINGVSVSDASEFQKALGKVGLEKGVRLQVRSEGKNRFVFLRRQR